MRTFDDTFKICSTLTEGMIDLLREGRHTTAWYVADDNHKGLFKTLAIQKAINFARKYSASGREVYIGLCLVGLYEANELIKRGD